MQRALVLGAILAIGLLSSRAHGQDDAKRSAARNFANDGLKALNEGKYADAIDLFGRAEALVHAPPHLLYMARASVQLGKLVQAKELYVKIAREEPDAKAPKAFLDAYKAAGPEGNALEPRIPTLTVVVSGEHAADASVVMDGAPLEKALVGVAHPVNPGTHTLKATAPGWTSSDVTIKLAEGAKETATLDLSKPVAAEKPAAPAPERKESRSLLPFIALGVGVVGAGLGTFFLLQNHSARDDADAICANGRCPSNRRGEVESLDSDANTASTLSWIGFGVGAAGVATGVALLVLNKPKDKTQEPTGYIQPFLGLGSAGMMGRF